MQSIPFRVEALDSTIKIERLPLFQSKGHILLVIWVESALYHTEHYYIETLLITSNAIHICFIDMTCMIDYVWHEV